MKKFGLSLNDRYIKGVCGGIGEWLGVNSLWVRIAFVVLVILWWWQTIVAYVLLALLTPAKNN